MNSLAIGIFLLALPLLFAGGLVYFMASGKGTKPLKDPENSNKEISEGANESNSKENKNTLTS